MRKLALCSSAFAAAIFTAEYLLMPHAADLRILVWLTTGFLCAGMVLAVFFRHRFLLAGLCVLFFGAGIFSYWANAELHSVPAELLVSKKLEFTCETLTYPETTETGYRVLARLKFPKGCDERPCDGLKCYIYSDDGAFEDLKPGRYIRLNGFFRSSEQKYGEDYDGFRSRGIYLLCTGKSSPELVDWENEDLFCRVRRFCNAGVQWLSHCLKNRIQTIFSGECAAFYQALMTGDKTELYECEDLYFAMSHAGITHIVAVSGMHVAYLVAVLQLLMGRKRSSSITAILIIWLFVLITGGSPSAARAAFMQSMLLMANVLRRENDTVTSLSFALAVILFVNPYAAASVSLQLSFAAVAGIALFSDKINCLVASPGRENIPHRILGYLEGIAATTLSVMVFTLPLTVVHFGYITVYSILTNLCSLWAVPVCFCGGYAVCLLSWIFLPFGKIAAVVLSLLARTAIFMPARWIASLPHAVLYFSNSLSTVWLILVYLLFFGFFLVHIRPALKVVLPVGISIALLCALYSYTAYTYTYNAPLITVLDVGQGECITAFSGNRTVVVDCGSIFTQDNAGDVAGQYLNGCQRYTIDLLILSHLDEDHINGLANLSRYVSIKRIVLPYYLNEEDNDNLQTVQQCAAQIGISPELLTWGGKETMNDLTVSMSFYDSGDSSNENCFFVTLSYQIFDILISGDNPAENEIQYVQDHDLSGIDVLVVGHHGSKYSSCEQYLQAVNPDKIDKPAVISVGYNTYGHPTEDALDRLSDYGFTVYRTDTDGNILIQCAGDGSFTVRD